MELEKPFGVITACHRGDYFLVKATCASIRHFCGDVPICVVVDGDFDVGELVRTYNVRILRTRELPDRRMRKLCSGSTLSKMAAMWAGPFERYLYLDADAIFWGDVVSKVEWDEEDFLVFWPELTGPAERSWLTRFYFNVDQLLAFDPAFSWEWNTYFCTGAFAARRGAITWDTWMRVENWWRNQPTMFSWTQDQGILNYLVFSKQQHGTLHVGRRDLQWIPEHGGIKETRLRFPSSLSTLPTTVPNVSILHFCGQKPHVHRLGAYSRNFTAARIHHYRRSLNKSGWFAIAAILREECLLIQERARRKISKLIGRFEEGVNANAPTASNRI